MPPHIVHADIKKAAVRLVRKFGLANQVVAEYLDISEETVRRAVIRWDSTGTFENSSSDTPATRGRRRALSEAEIGLGTSCSAQS
jgi:transposase